MVKWINYGLSMLLITMLMSCSIFGDKDKDEERENSRALTEKQLYERVQVLLSQESFDLAVKNLQLLESRFPFGTYAEQSQLEIIYAYYRNNDEDSAIASAERFIRLHSSHSDADYAWYMRGLANYSLKPGLLSRFYQSDKAQRDVASAERSFREFEQFIQRYPDSLYAADARARMIYIKYVLARHELVVANYYVKRKAYTAAINRARTVIENFQGSASTADALALLVFCYQQMDLQTLAETNLLVLRDNFPNHPSFDQNGNYMYGDNYELDKRSRLNRYSLGLLDTPRAPVFDSRK
tara:strand:+ start:1070 stop:1960 length:891 start_codon:yes stop_codon:yes gene_type:complete